MTLQDAYKHLPQQVKARCLDCGSYLEIPKEFCNVCSFCASNWQHAYFTTYKLPFVEFTSFGDTALGA